MNIKVKGGQILSGEITPSGSKNSAVALIPASILFDKEILLENIPDITDVQKLTDILMKLGSKITWNKDDRSMLIDNSNLSFEKMQKEDVGTMKGTSLLWGPMMARFGKVIFDDLPRGCTLGVRPLDPQYKAFRDLGAMVEENLTSVKMDATNARSGEIWLDEMSPTATENVVMLSTSLPGKTRIIGAASEPQVQDLCEFLVKCGAKINGIGSSILEVEGGIKLTPKKHRIYPDHYEIAAFMAMVAATGGTLKVNEAMPGKLNNIINVFKKFGLETEYQNDAILLRGGQNININSDHAGKTLTVRAQPWPALPVDLLPIFIPLALSAKTGQVLFHNWMYEAGLFWTSELTKLGANIIMADPHRIIVTAGNKLFGTTLEAPYIIRAVVSMVMAAMIAEGESVILNADALYRGHPHFSENLRKLGARIEEVS